MKQDLLERQYNYRRDPSTYAEDELTVLILKPGYTKEYEQRVASFIAINQLELLWQNLFYFDSKSTLALYNDIFRFNHNDILFGYDWKSRKLAYMISGSSHVYILRGRNAQSLAEAFKYQMRSSYGKLSVPDRKLTSDEFEELAIKNIIHVVDGTEVEVALWLLA